MIKSKLDYQQKIRRKVLFASISAFQINNRPHLLRSYKDIIEELKDEINNLSDEIKNHKNISRFPHNGEEFLAVGFYCLIVGGLLWLFLGRPEDPIQQYGRAFVSPIILISLIIHAIEVTNRNKNIKKMYKKN